MADPPVLGIQGQWAESREKIEIFLPNLSQIIKCLANKDYIMQK